MDNFKEKIKSFCKIQSEIDEHIWEVFYAYINQEKINFSDPYNWNIDDGETSIQFTGSDGCMGCYDNQSIDIPLVFFINPKNELLKLKNKRITEEAKKKRAAKTAITKRDKKEFKRLKKKFGDE